MNTIPELAIVIPAKNEETHLPNLLASLKKQDYLQHASTKVFVADAGSTDGTISAVLSFRPELEVEIIAGGRPSVGRNNGAAASDSKFILFLDADVALSDPTLISRTVKAMRSRALHCATVDIECTSKAFADKLLYRASNLVQHVTSLYKPFGTGMFLMVDRARFNALGGFNEESLFAEDYQFTMQISPLRFAIVRGAVQTSNRRFESTGHLRMVTLFFRTALNAGNQRHFQKDHGYWDTPHSTERPAV